MRNTEVLESKRKRGGKEATDLVTFEDDMYLIPNGKMSRLYLKMLFCQEKIEALKKSIMERTQMPVVSMLPFSLVSCNRLLKEASPVVVLCLNEQEEAVKKLNKNKRIRVFSVTEDALLEFLDKKEDGLKSENHYKL